MTAKIEIIHCKVGDRVRLVSYAALFSNYNSLPKSEEGDSEREEMESATYVVEYVKPVDAKDSIRDYGKAIEGLADVDMRNEKTRERFLYIVDNSNLKFTEEVKVMKRLINKLQRTHPLAAMASIGVIVFVSGAVVKMATTTPEVMMLAGGMIVALSGLIAIDSDDRY